MIPISYHPKQAFIKNFIQYGIFIFVTLLFFPQINFLSVLIALGCTFFFATLITLTPYLDVYRKISTLYKDNNNNLYVDKVLVDKNRIEFIQFDSPGLGPKRNQYYIMTFGDLPAIVKENNFHKNSVVFCELETLSNWPNLNNKTQKLLKDIGIKITVQYSTKK